METAIPEYVLFAFVSNIIIAFVIIALVFLSD